MSTTTWKILNLYRDLPDGPDYPDGKVYAAEWCATASDQGESMSTCGSIGFDEPDPNNYTPYAQVTEAEALQWVFDALGIDRVVEIQEMLYKKVQEKLNPTEKSGTPWA